MTANHGRPGPSRRVSDGVGAIERNGAKGEVSRETGASPTLHLDDLGGPSRRGVWGGIIGAAYTTASMARILGITRGRVAADADELRLLRAYTADGQAVFPAFQVADGRVPLGLQTVLRILRTGVDDPWTWAQWLNATPIASKPGDAPSRHIDRLHDGALEDVVRDATHAAASWAA